MKCYSLHADEIKLWLTPSAKQHRNPCSGLPAVYPDLSTRHNWPVKKGLCFVCRDRQSGWRGIRNALLVIRWGRWGPEQGSLRCFADSTNQSLVIVCTQARNVNDSLHFRRGPCTVSSWNKPCVSLLKGNNILTLYKTWIKIINVHSMDINMTWFADIKTFFTDRGTSASFKHMWTLLLTTFFFFYVYSYNPTVRRLVWTHQEKKKKTYVILEKVYLHIKYKLLGMLSWVLRL